MDPYNNSDIEMCYTMQPNRDGYIGNAIIIATKTFGNEVRHGTLKDVENLMKFSRMLSLKPRVFVDLKADEIHNMMDVITRPPHERPSDLSESRIMPEHSAILVIVVSHGKADSFLTTDGKLFPVRKLYSFLNEDNCLLMRGKPKIILMNKCGTKGGDVYGTPVFDSDVMSGGENIFNGASTFSNFLYISSCSIDTLSHSSTETGSFFISALPKEYEKYGRGKEFRKFIQILRLQMIKEVNIKVQDSPGYANATQCITTELDSLLWDICFPQTVLMAGSSDCESLDMEVEITPNLDDDEMEVQCTREERLPRCKYLLQRIVMRMKMYKKAHHTYRPGGHKYRIKRILSLN